MPRPIPRNRIQIKERREDVLVLLTKGIKGYEIARKLGVDASTVSRDIQYLISQSHNYLNSLAKEALPVLPPSSTLRNPSPTLFLSPIPVSIEKFSRSFCSLLSSLK